MKMKLRSRNKHKLINVKQEVSSISFSLDTERTYLVDKGNVLKHGLPDFNLKEEDFSDDKFKVENNHSQTNSRPKKTSQIHNVATKNVKYIETEVKQEVTAKPEELLSTFSGKYNLF